MNRKARRSLEAQERRARGRPASTPIPLDAPEGEPCGCGEEFDVDVTRGTFGPFTWAVAGQPGCMWAWWVEQDGETVAEGDETTREAALWAAEANARAFVLIDHEEAPPGSPGRH